jgi:hypothetical protein
VVGLPIRSLGTMLEDTMRNLSATAVAAMLFLAACAPEPPPPPPETARSYTGDRAATYERLVAALRAQGIASTGDASSGLIRAAEDFVGRDSWVDCRSVWVVDQTSNSLRRQVARSIHRHLSLLITVTGDAAGSHVELDLQFSEKLTDPFRNQVFDEPCYSRGALEALLLAAPARGS